MARPNPRRTASGDQDVRVSPDRTAALSGGQARAHDPQKVSAMDSKVVRHSRGGLDSDEG